MKSKLIPTQKVKKREMGLTNLDSDIKYTHKQSKS